MGARLAALLVFCGAVACAGAQETTLPVAPAAPAAQQVDREIQIASDAFVKDPTLPAWVQPYAIPTPTAATATGAAVLQLSDTQVMVTDRPVTYVRRAIRINDTSALTAFGRVPIPFIAEYQKIALHTLQIVRDGAVLDRLAGAQVRFLQREADLENNVYSGIVTASILLDDVRVGDTIELAYSTSGINPVFGRFSGGENWDQALPIEARRLIVNAPIARRVAWKFHGDLARTFPSPVETVRDGIRSTRFEERSLPAVPPEAGSPPGFNVGRWVQLSEWADWQDVATWAAALFAIDEPPSAERKALVATLMARPTIEERVVRALELVQSQVRYFSVSLGTSSHRPTAPNTVLTRRYGDCKDKSLLLVTLLKDMGIASTPVLARLGNRTGFDAWLPTPLAFDHVVVAVDVDGSRYWLDSTRLGQHGRLARMGQVHDGAQVLPAVAVDGRLQRIVVANRDALSRDERVESLKIAKLDGEGELTIVQTAVGVSAEAGRVVLSTLPKDRLDTALTAAIEARYPGAKLIDTTRIDDDRTDNRFTLTVRFMLPKPAERANGQWRVAYRPDNLQRIFPALQDTRRRTPIALRFPLVASYRFEVEFPDDVTVANDPVTTEVGDHTFRTKSYRAFRGNRFETALEVTTLADRVEVADLTSVRDDLQKFTRSVPNVVVVGDADIKKSAFLGLGRKDLATTMRARQEDIVARVSTTLASGRLAGADLVRAHCTRAAALASLERFAEAERDGDQGVAADPDAPDALLCRGEARLAAGSFAAAIDDFSQAIVFGSDRGRVYYVRGQARFHLGRYAEAADDFTKAATIDRDAQVLLQYDLWRALALLRGGKPLTADLQQRAAAEERGDWPRPALALLAGRLSPDALRAVVAQKPGDVGQLDATEADFFIGEHFLAKNERDKAREAFTASRARGVITYTEHAASGHELKKLDGAGG